MARIFPQGALEDLQVMHDLEEGAVVSEDDINLGKKARREAAAIKDVPPYVRGIIYAEIVYDRIINGHDPDDNY